MQDFSKAGAGKQQEADRGDCIGVELPSPVLLRWRMFGRCLGFVGMPRQPDGLSLVESVCQARQLYCIEVALAGPLFVRLDAFCWIELMREFSNLCPIGKQTGKGGNDTVGRHRPRLANRAVQLRDIPSETEPAFLLPNVGMTSPVR